MSLPERLSALLDELDRPVRHMPPTTLYNEGWMLVSDP